jgi:hypothetical protein
VGYSRRNIMRAPADVGKACSGTEPHTAGESVTEIAYRPSRFEVIRRVAPGKQKNARRWVQAPGPDLAMLNASFLAHIAVVQVLRSTAALSAGRHLRPPA